MAKIEMDVINPHCGGIDIGSRSHFVAIGQGEKDVREFGVYPDDLVGIW
jgi:transposase